MKTYLNQLQSILETGQQKGDRTGTGTLSLFGLHARYNLAESFPAMTTKKLAWKAVVSELLWFLEGSSDERRLAEILHGTRSENKKTIWSGNANSKDWLTKARYPGDVGQAYGVQWRKWGPRIGNHIDQIQVLIDGIKKDPNGRRHIVTAWQPGELDQTCLPPCHVLMQYYVVNNKLSCCMYQRSADYFLGVPFNIASEALLTHMIAQVCDLEVGEFVHMVGDGHIYNNHIEQVTEQLKRNPLPPPTLWINPTIKNIDDFTMEDFALENYVSHDSIKAEMAV